ncbi:hypothetical protein GCM10010245_77270 [Streptomyces spectabilis]|nr:hypothetical protein GCM10010245_77270 [Streptomyces spectabilis]
MWHWVMPLSLAATMIGEIPGYGACEAAWTANGLAWSESAGRLGLVAQFPAPLRGALTPCPLAIRPPDGLECSWNIRGAPTQVPHSDTGRRIGGCSVRLLSIMRYGLLLLSRRGEGL